MHYSYEKMQLYICADSIIYYFKVNIQRQRTKNKVQKQTFMNFIKKTFICGQKKKTKFPTYLKSKKQLYKNNTILLSIFFANFQHILNNYMLICIIIALSFL